MKIYLIGDPLSPLESFNLFIKNTLAMTIACHNFYCEKLKVIITLVKKELISF